MKNGTFTLLSTLFFAFFTFSTVHAHSWVILGGNRGAGYALASEILTHAGDTCTLLVRDAAKTAELFANKDHSNLRIVEADVVKDVTTITRECSDADFIVPTQTFPYKNKIWERSLPQMIDNALDAAQSSGATVIYYGRIYPYAVTRIITETTAQEPEKTFPPTKDGASTIPTTVRVLGEVEQKLEQAHGVKTIIIRHSTPFGPHIGDGLLEPSFRGIPKNKNLSWYQSTNTFRWIGSSETKARTLPIQMTYTPDLARFTYTYGTSLVHGEKQHDLINFAGINTTLDQFAHAYCAIAESDCAFTIHSSSALSFASIADSEAERANSVFYSFENEILLDATHQKEVFPFELTSLEDSLTAVFDAYTS
jgi:hypothetical protein